MKQNRPRLQIIRGLPGSGKTTLAINRYPFLLRLETDMYFYSRGAYRFSMNRNINAVSWFMESVWKMCESKSDFVVTGVFAAHTERLNHTIETALSEGYDVYIKTLTTQYKGIHAVPEEHFNSMKASFVSDRKLREIYKRYQRVHFGLMPTDYPLAHLKK